MATELFEEKEKGSNVSDLKQKSSDELINNLENEIVKLTGVIKEEENKSKTLTDQLNLKLSKLKDPEAFIPKQTAALEVYRELVNAKNIFIYAIVSSLIIAATSAYFVFIGAIVAGIVCMGFAVMMMKKNQRIKYLQDKYELPKAGLFKKVV